MAERIPLIVDSVNANFKELPVGDNLNLAGSNFTANGITANTVTATTVTSNLTGNVTGNTAGVHTGNVTGNLTGNVNSTLVTSATVSVSGTITSANNYSNTYVESIKTVSTLAANVSLDLASFQNFEHTLANNVTYAFANAPSSASFGFTLKIVQDAGASGYTVTWPASVDWPSATAPTLTSTASAVDMFVFTTNDGGTTFYGFTAGQALG